MHNSREYIDDSLIKPFEETLLFSDYEDTVVDYAELPLDQLSELLFKDAPEALVELPIIKGIVAIGRLGWSIRRAVVTRNQLAFIQSLKRGNPDSKAVDKRRQALEKNEKWVKKEIETTLIYLERFTDSHKAKYQARLYRDLLDNKITYDNYEEYLVIIDNIMMTDIEYLLDIYDYCIGRKLTEISQKALAENHDLRFEAARCRRLELWGLLHGIITPTMGSAIVDRYMMSDKGLYMYTIVLDDKDKKHAHIKYTIKE